MEAGVHEGFFLRKPDRAFGAAKMKNGGAFGTAKMGRGGAFGF